MAELKEIKDFKIHMENRHANRIAQQNIDQKFFNDTFFIPFVKTKEGKKVSDYEIRTGFVAEMANGFTQQLVSSVPKVYTEAKIKGGKVTKETELASDRIASVANKWCKYIGKQTHNPFKQTFKSLAFTRGEAWIYVPHRPELAMYEGNWREDYPEAIPCHFILYDPMVVFSEPSEYVDGKPTRVLVYYKRMVSDIAANYPYWTKVKNHKDNEEVEFLLFSDKNMIYAEADNEPLFRTPKGKYINEDGRKSNIYGCVNFAHAYSGWGMETEDKKPELLAFSRTRMIRGRVEEDTSMATDFRYNIHAFAFKHRTLTNKSGQELSADFTKEYHPNEPGKLSILNIPPGADMTVEETQLFEAPVFAYRSQVRADLNAAYPSPLRGSASGTSGRQEDILANNGLTMYDCVVENNSTLWAEAFKIALKISYALPDMIPYGLKTGDNDSYCELTVDTRREDPQEMARNMAAGQMLYERGLIDHETFLIEHQGKTKEEAKKIKAKTWVEQVIRNHPAFAEMVLQAMAQELGAENQLAQVETELAGQKINPTVNYGSRGGEQRKGNIKSLEGVEMAGMGASHEPRVSRSY